jgi:hypothetical protein
LLLGDRPGIAVLPFINMSGDRRQEYFSDGISEDIITALSKLRWFFVIARNSSFVYKGRSVHINEIANDLGVRYVVEGSVSPRAAIQVRISAQLNDVSTGSHPVGRALRPQHRRRLRRAGRDHGSDRRRGRTASLCRRKLSCAAQGAGQPRCLGLVMRGMSHFWRVTRQDNTVAQALLEKAIRHRSALRQGAGAARHQPNLRCPLWAGPTWQARCRWPPREALAAVEADSEDAWAHHGLAIPTCSRGASTMRSPSSSWRCASIRILRSRRPFYAVTLCYAGRYEERRRRDPPGRCGSARAIRVPRSTSVLGAYIQFAARRYDEAIQLARESLRQRGDFVGAHRVLTAAAGMAGDTELAAIALQGLRQGCSRISRWNGSRANCRMNRSRDREHYLDGLAPRGIDESVADFAVHTNGVRPGRSRGHNHRCQRVRRAGATARLTTTGCGYGSRLSPGRHWRVARDLKLLSTISPLPPSSAGKSFSLGRPSRIGSTVSA